MDNQIQYRFIFKILLCLLLSYFLFSGCATYYENTREFHRYYKNKNFTKAEEILDKTEPSEDSNTRLLFLLQKGMVNFMQQNYVKSNDYFEQAYLYIEDLQKNYAKDAISLITNPTLRPYKGEDFEVVLIHYYKAMNFINLKLYDEALVESRRLNLRLNQINDRYSTKKNRYKTDAFALYIMGMLYEAAFDYNNAFIAYRNALDAYSAIYEKDFYIKVPDQLKRDLIRLAKLNGFYEELEEYKNKFNIQYDPAPRKGKGEVIVLWQNGLGPIKDEWGISFVVVENKGGMITFENKSLGISMKFESGSSNSTSLKDIKVLRVAFPKYVERRPYYQHALITVAGKEYDFELVENINEIAFKTLEDRMLRELGEGLLRLALKKASEKVADEVQEGLGTLLSFVNAATERADTRNWQTLPHGIFLSRILIEPDQDTITVAYSGATKKETIEYNVDCREGGIVFLIINTIESRSIK